jgi:hypothetical protein
LDEHGASTKGPIWKSKTRGNKPPSAPKIKVHKDDSSRKYYITIKSTDPDGDNVFYFIDWGNGTFIDWLGPYKSGENVTISHSWPPVTKLFELHAFVNNIFGAESNWV